MGRAQRCDREARARRHGRRDLDHRGRRPDARRRARLADGQVWAGRRQPRVGRARDRRRLAHGGDRGVRRGPFLGAARRWRELRDRYGADVSTTPASDGHGRSDRPPDRRSQGAAALLPGRRRRRAGRAGGVRRPRLRARRLRDEARGDDRLPFGRPGAGRARPRTAHRLGIAARRRGRRDALSGDEPDPRRRLPDRLAQLLAVELHRRHVGCPDRRSHRPIRVDPFDDVRDPVRALPRRRDADRGDRDRGPPP